MSVTSNHTKRTTENPRNNADMDQQETKNSILARIRAGKPSFHPLPEVPCYGYPGDPVTNFVNKLLEFDGRAIKFKTRQDAIEWLSKQPETDSGKNVIYSSADGVDGNITEDELSDLHNAHRIETCVTDSHLGVGEMGSVWVTDNTLRHAACALLSRRLFIFLDSNDIVGGLHDAYSGIRLEIGRAHF